MADYDGITDLYRITGVRNIGSGYVLPKTRIVKKKKNRPEDEEESRQKEKELLKSAKEMREGIDIEV